MSFSAHFPIHPCPLTDYDQRLFTEYLLRAKTDLTYLLLMCTTCEAFAVFPK